MSVEVVITNYKRPANTLRICKAFQEQSIPCMVTVIDAAPSPEFAVNPDANRYVRLTENHGGFNRFLLVALHEQEFTYFHDDDMLPGRRLIEHYERNAESIGEFGVLGQFGRKLPGDTYDGTRTTLGVAPLVVDMVCRSYFVRTANLHNVLALRSRVPLPARLIDDDMLLCFSMTAAGLRNYTSVQPEQDESAAAEELPDPFAFSARPNHFALRTQMLQTIRAAMGTSLRGKSCRPPRTAQGGACC